MSPSWNLPEPGGGHIPRTVFRGGAHDVVSTHGGCIIAPMGRRGILLMDPKRETAQSVRTLKPADEALYIYKVISLASPGRGEILACAGRQGGFATMPLAGGLRTTARSSDPLVSISSMSPRWMSPASRSPWRHLGSIVRSTSSVTSSVIRRRQLCI